ncbi:MAG: hypothetical protein V2A54_08735 [Bacteroidota bacterium]
MKQSFIIASILLLFISFSFTVPNKKPDYNKIADRIINKVIAMSDKEYYLDGISKQDVYTTDDCGCRTIELKWQKDARGDPPKENYLILDLTFRFCKNDSLPEYNDPELNIGKMSVIFNSYGKGHDEMDVKIKEIILKERESFKKK